MLVNLVELGKFSPSVHVIITTQLLTARRAFPNARVYESADNAFLHERHVDIVWDADHRMVDQMRSRLRCVRVLHLKTPEAVQVMLTDHGDRFVQVSTTVFVHMLSCRVDMLDIWTPEFPGDMDVLIPVEQQNIKYIDGILSHTNKNVKDLRQIIIVTNADVLHTRSITRSYSNVQVMDEDTMDVVRLCKQHINGTRPSSRKGWYLQQLIKLYAWTIPGISNNYLVLDADTFLFRPTEFVVDGKLLFSSSDESHAPYREHRKTLHPNLDVDEPESGICHHMVFNTTMVQGLLDLVERHNSKPFWLSFVDAVQNDHWALSGASEYEMFFIYVCRFVPECAQKRLLQQQNSGMYDPYFEGDLLSVHHYMLDEMFLDSDGLSRS